MERRVTENLDPSPQVDTMPKTFHLIHLTLNKYNYRTSKKKCLHYLLCLISEMLILMLECYLKQFFFFLLLKITTSWVNSFMNWPVGFTDFCTCSWTKATLCLLASAPAFSKASPFTLLLSLKTSWSYSHTKKYLFPPVLSLVAFSPSLHCPQWWLPPGLYCGLSTDFPATQQLAEWSSWNMIRPGCSSN